VGVVGQIAPNLEYSLNTIEYSYLADELKKIYPFSYEKSVEGNNKSVDLLVFLEHVR
jgi:hypothetical protein